MPPLLRLEKPPQVRHEIMALKMDTTPPTMEVMMPPMVLTMAIRQPPRDLRAPWICLSERMMLENPCGMASGEE